jgi:hypothetical protein
MSYILEALRRAERERAQGQVPTGNEVTAHAAAQPPGRSPLLKILIAVLAVNALVFGAILLRPKPAATLSAEPASTAAAPQTATAPPPASAARITSPAVSRSPGRAT